MEGSLIATAREILWQTNLDTNGATVIAKKTTGRAERQTWCHGIEQHRRVGARILELLKSTLLRLVPHQLVSEDKDADREEHDENVSDRIHPMAAKSSESFPLRRPIGTPCHDRTKSLDQQQHKKPVRSQIEQRRPTSGDQIPPERDVGLHANNLLTISGRSDYAWPAVTLPNTRQKFPPPTLPISLAVKPWRSISPTTA